MERISVPFERKKKKDLGDSIMYMYVIMVKIILYVNNEAMKHCLGQCVNVAIVGWRRYNVDALARS